MTDPEIADGDLRRAADAEVVERIIERERPDALLPTLGGQTGAQPRPRAGTTRACSSATASS